MRPITHGAALEFGTQLPLSAPRILGPAAARRPNPSADPSSHVGNSSRQIQQTGSSLAKVVEVRVRIHTYVMRLIARASTIAMVMSAIVACAAISALAWRLNGMTSVGLKAVALVNAR